MNRVVLCGRLSARPALAYTPCGVAVVQYRLLVPRDTPLDGGHPPPHAIDCVAFGEVAEHLNLWGEPGHRVNLEGQLRPETYQVDGRQFTGVRVHSDRAYFVDPVEQPLPASGWPRGIDASRPTAGAAARNGATE